MSLSTRRVLWGITGLAIVVIAIIAIHQAHDIHARIQANSISTRLVGQESSRLCVLYGDIRAGGGEWSSLGEFMLANKNIADTLIRTEPYARTNMFINESAVIGGGVEPWVMSPEIDLAAGGDEFQALEAYHDSMELPMRFVLYSDGTVVPLRHLSDVERERCERAMVEWLGSAGN